VNCHDTKTSIPVQNVTVYERTVHSSLSRIGLATSMLAHETRCYWSWNDAFMYIFDMLDYSVFPPC